VPARVSPVASPSLLLASTHPLELVPLGIDSPSRSAVSRSPPRLVPRVQVKGQQVDRWHPGSSVDDMFAPDLTVVQLNHSDGDSDSFFVGHVTPEGLPDGMGVLFKRRGENTPSGRKYFHPFVGMFRAGCRCGWGVGRDVSGNLQSGQFGCNCAPIAHVPYRPAPGFCR
jgi:hypothetical protein